jgi:hypothetical protein
MTKKKYTVHEIHRCLSRGLKYTLNPVGNDANKTLQGPYTLRAQGHFSDSVAFLQEVRRCLWISSYQKEPIDVVKKQQGKGIVGGKMHAGCTIFS